MAGEFPSQTPLVVPNHATSLVTRVLAGVATMRSWIWVVLALGVVVARFAFANTIYRCLGAAGEVAFSDLPCSDGRVQKIQPTMTIDMAVSAQERATLDRLDRISRARPRDTNDKTARGDSANRDARRCAAAQAGLDRIRAKKRSGYRVSSAAALDARERDYQSRYDRECAPTRR